MVAARHAEKHTVAPSKLKKQLAAFMDEEAAETPTTAGELMQAKPKKKAPKFGK